jgi:VanZ family protein
MLAMLTLIAASVEVVIRQWAAELGLFVPTMIGIAMAQAIVAALIAFALLPSASPTPNPATVTQGSARADVLQAFGKSAGLVALLGFAARLEDNSAILVALTAVNILAASAEIAAQTQGRVLLLANLAAAAVALPLIAVATVQPNAVVLLLLAMAGGLWMARGVAGEGLPRIIARAGLPVFVVLLGLLLPKAGEAALTALADRLLTLGLVMFYALAVLALLRPTRRRGWRGAERMS